VARLRVRVTPKSGADRVVGLSEGELHVRVRAVPEDGKATAAACALVASFLGVPKSHVTLDRGGASRHKSLQVEGLTQAELEARLSEPPST
jgi:uncharacterized protein YggU (UPF0235/DUF167 family)